MSNITIKTGGTYSNGNFHGHWEVRQVLARGIPCEEESAIECVKYKVLVGARRRRSFVCSSEEFSRWARYEVTRDENSWFKIESS
ncbi:MAG: hypothetical protein C3F18_10745 [Nitrosomonadales bacterium]|nr:MAG: hypothetical protein C3F18_10745 [Nitrosomonadales bacterium]